MRLHLIFQRFNRWLKSFALNATDTRYALAEACLIGVLSAIAALILKQGVGWLGGQRVALANKFGGIVV
ncbi:MAG: hypothetical protein AB4057_18620, partial [Crocosphaera sp.]